MKCLRAWFIAEWGKEGTFDLGGSVDPGPLVAIADGDLVGGLAFASYRRPGSEASGLWINALFVTPKYRRRGIASQLIRAAEAEAARFGERELYALTDIPKLYEKLGWRCIQCDSSGTVVGRTTAT